MIYASDLDRTLIYSESFINSYGIRNNNGLRLDLVDVSTVNSYISHDVAIRLRRIIGLEGLRFIPVTTRGLSEYQRISIPGVSAEYAITTNGGLILHNGEVMKERQDDVERNVDISELGYIKDELDRLDCITYSSRVVDGIQIFTKTNNLKSIQFELDRLAKGHRQYKFYNSGHKVYVVPYFITKGSTLKWLKRKLNEDKIVASGDSTLDESMLDIADFAIIPSHHSLDDEKVKKSKYIKVFGEVNSPLNTFDILESLLHDQ